MKDMGKIMPVCNEEVWWVGRWKNNKYGIKKTFELNEFIRFYTIYSSGIFYFQRFLKKG